MSKQNDLTRTPQLRPQMALDDGIAGPFQAQEADMEQELSEARLLTSLETLLATSGRKFVIRSNL